MNEAGTTPNGDQPQAQPASLGLRLAVYGMGVAIIVLIVVMALGLMLGWHKKGEKAETPADPLSTAAPATASGPVTLEITTAAESRLYTLAGDGSRIALHIAAPTGDEIVVIDTVKNRVISRIRLTPG